MSSLRVPSTPLASWFALLGCALSMGTPAGCKNGGDDAPKAASGVGANDASYSEDTGAPDSSGFVPMAVVWIPPGTFLMGSDYAQTRACTNGSPPSSLGLRGAEVTTWCKEHGPAKWFEDESPARHVRIERGFWISDAEVTYEAFERFVESTGYRTTAERAGKSLGEATSPETMDLFHATASTWRAPWPGATGIDRHPVTHVSWADSLAFCKWMSAETGQTWTLPSEVQWEYAALAGRDRSQSWGTYSWGDTGPREEAVGNVADARFAALYPNWKYPTAVQHDDHHARTAPVRSYAPNRWGLFDMTGNVWEWTLDVDDGDVVRPSCGAVPTEPCSASELVVEGERGFHIMRGGAFDFEMPFQRIQKRRTLSFAFSQDAVRSSISVGFRVVRIPHATQEAKQSEEQTEVPADDRLD